MDLSVPNSYLREWMEKGVSAPIPPKYLTAIYKRFYRWLIMKIIRLTREDITKDIKTDEDRENAQDAIEYVMSESFIEHCRDLHLDWRTLREEFSEILMIRNGGAL